MTLCNRLEDNTSPNRFVEMASTSAAYWQNYNGQTGKSVSVDVDDIEPSLLSLGQRVLTVSGMEIFLAT